MTDEPAPKGVKTRLFGAAFLFLGLLDSLLSWRSGETPNRFYLILVVSGIILLAVGSLRSRSYK